MRDSRFRNAITGRSRKEDTTMQTFFRVLPREWRKAVKEANIRLHASK
jgi:hypothetical protein